MTQSTQHVDILTIIHRIEKKLEVLDNNHHSLHTQIINKQQEIQHIEQAIESLIALQSQLSHQNSSNDSSEH